LAAFLGGRIDLLANCGKFYNFFAFLHPKRLSFGNYLQINSTANVVRDFIGSVCGSGKNFLKSA
jgi:hypothetical protein